MQSQTVLHRNWDRITGKAEQGMDTNIKTKTLISTPKASRPRRQQRRGIEEWGRCSPLPSRLEGLGSVVSSPLRPKTNLVHFGFKIRHLVATILMIFLRIHLLNLVQLKQ